MPGFSGIREEELKNKVAKEFFAAFDCTRIIGNIDFCVTVPPPAFLGAFDAEKIAFIPYRAVLDIFYQNDFNWNVTPSDHETKVYEYGFLMG